MLSDSTLTDLEAVELAARRAADRVLRAEDAAAALRHFAGEIAKIAAERRLMFPQRKT